MIEITNEYQQVLDAIDNKVSPIFVTGGAGVGKSTLINYIQKNYKNVVTVAPTGIAAINVRGATIHSTFRIPPKYITPFDKAELKASDILARADLIIIDEVSMVNANLLDAMEYVLRLSKRKIKEVFGGIPVVMFGDLYQLPPVITNTTKKLFETNYNTPYFFSAKCLTMRKLYTIELTKVFRQADVEFVNILNNIRRGHDIENTIQYLNDKLKIVDNDDVEEGCIIATTVNRKCSDINNKNLRKIKSKEYTYVGKISGKFPVSSLPTDSMIDLKVGSQVMVVKNVGNLFNGTLGKVIALNDDSVRITTKYGDATLNKVVWENHGYRVRGGVITSNTMGTYEQIPLKLAWGITIHKSQGQTLDRIHIDMDNGSFVSGQLYVALSRCTTLDGITLSRKLYTTDVIVDDEIKEFYKNISN